VFSEVLVIVTSRPGSSSQADAAVVVHARSLAALLLERTVFIQNNKTNNKLNVM
jgi:hypothetical protein